MNGNQTLVGKQSSPSRPDFSYRSQSLSSVLSPDYDGTPDQGRNVTPRRKLCLDDSIKSPTDSQSSCDSAYAGSPKTTLDNSQFQSITPKSSALKELSTNVGKPVRDIRKLHPRSRRNRLSLHLPGKENEGIPDKNSPRPVSCTSFSPEGSGIRQIDSPLSRMSLLSPMPSSSGSNSSDGYFSEVFENMENDPHSLIPESFSTLFAAPINHRPLSSKSKPPTPMRRGSQPTILLRRRDSLKRTSPHREESEERKAKRPPLPLPPSPVPPKKPIKSVSLFRSQSVFVPHCENAMFPDSPGEHGVEKIGDHSKPYALPLCKGGVPDLKNISSDTLADLIDGKFKEISTFRIIDCRYPYEYEGGHIQGSENIWEKETLVKEFFPEPCSKISQPDDGGRHVIVYHCEFSSKRGPDMSRYMRRIDREKNGMSFPKLYYPELYLLDGGYKVFFEKHPELCTPQNYVKMIDDEYKDDLKYFKNRSKSWTGSSRRQPRLLRQRHSIHETASPGDP